MAFHSRSNMLAALEALGKWLSKQPEIHGLHRFEFLICGGACFLFHGLHRFRGITNDVDVWCQFENDEIIPLTPWPDFLALGIEAVSLQFTNPLPAGWLSCDASSISRTFGLPAGAKERATMVNFGPHLRAHFCGRQDIVAFKFLELVASTMEPNKEKALGDLLALKPTPEERASAREWLVNIPKGTQGWKDLCEKELAKWKDGIGG